MNHYAPQWIQGWCEENGWTDWFIERSRYWAFPPNAVMPLPIPIDALKAIKAKHGLCFEEKMWCFSAIISAISGVFFSYFLASPMPAVAAFAFCTITVARMEDELSDCESPLS